MSDPYEIYDYSDYVTAALDEQAAWSEQVRVADLREDDRATVDQMLAATAAARAASRKLAILRWYVRRKKYPIDVRLAIENLAGLLWEGRDFSAEYDSVNADVESYDMAPHLWDALIDAEDEAEDRRTL